MVTKPNEKRIKRVLFISISGCSSISDRSNVPRVFFTRRRLPEVKVINVRLVSFLLQKVALWETSQGEENISF